MSEKQPKDPVKELEREVIRLETLILSNQRRILKIELALRGIRVHV